MENGGIDYMEFGKNRFFGICEAYQGMLGKGAGRRGGAVDESADDMYEADWKWGEISRERVDRLCQGLMRELGERIACGRLDPKKVSEMVFSASSRMDAGDDVWNAFMDGVRAAASVYGAELDESTEARRTDGGRVDESTNGDVKAEISGRELLEKWRKAYDAVDGLRSAPGEIGGGLHRAGYHVFYDGFSVCCFGKKGESIRFSAHHYDGPWSLGRWIDLGDGGKVKVDDIDPDATYPFEVTMTAAERFDRGLLKPDRFVVSTQSGEYKYFDDFESADRYARNQCQEWIDRRWNDRDTTRYFETEVRNDERRAAERSVLRYYRWYDYPGHPHFYEVDAAK